MYVDQCNLVNRLISESKMKFYSSIIEGNSSNQFELFRAVEKMLNLKAPPELPSHDCATDLANRFADFFTEKVQAIPQEKHWSLQALTEEMKCNLI